MTGLGAEFVREISLSIHKLWASVRFILFSWIPCAHCGLSEVTVWLSVPLAIVHWAGASWISSLKSQDVLVQNFNA